VCVCVWVREFVSEGWHYELESCITPTLAKREKEEERGESWRGSATFLWMNAWHTFEWGNCYSSHATRWAFNVQRLDSCFVLRFIFRDFPQVGNVWRVARTTLPQQQRQFDNNNKKGNPNAIFACTLPGNGVTCHTLGQTLCVWGNPHISVIVPLFFCAAPPFFVYFVLFFGLG